MPGYVEDILKKRTLMALIKDITLRLVFSVAEHISSAHIQRVGGTPAPQGNNQMQQGHSCLLLSAFSLVFLPCSSLPCHTK